MTEQNSDELQALIKEAVESAFNMGRGFTLMEPSFEDEELMAAEKATEIIALVEADVAARLLSDGAVDELLERTLGWTDYEKGETYVHLPEAEKEEWRREGRHYLIGSLRHIGIESEATVE